MHDGHRQRIRNRFIQEGLDHFAPHEVLELILFYALPRKDTNALAHSLMRHFGSFRAVLEAHPKDIQKVHGIGENAAVLISTIIPLMRYYEAERFKSNKSLYSRQDAENFCTSLFIGKRIECMYMLCLDTQYNLLAVELIAEGTVDSAVIYERELVSKALLHETSAVLLAHNHPGGGKLASPEDIKLTLQIKRILSLINIHMLDHYIVTGNECVSIFAQIEHLENDVPLHNPPMHKAATVYAPKSRKKPVKDTRTKKNETKE